MSAKNKTRLQLELRKDAVDRLDILKDKTCAASRAEVVRRALRLYEYVIEQTLEGEVMWFEKDGEFKQAIVP